MRHKSLIIIESYAIRAYDAYPVADFVFPFRGQDYPLGFAFQHSVQLSQLRRSAVNIGASSAQLNNSLTGKGS